MVIPAGKNMTKITSKTTPNYVSKSQLLDYVNKFEFNEFRDEMREFRANTEERFANIDKRFDAVDRRFDRLEESFRVQTGVILQEMRSISQTTIEYMKGIEQRVGNIERALSIAN